MISRGRPLPAKILIPRDFPLHQALDFRLRSSLTIPAAAALEEAPEDPLQAAHGPMAVHPEEVGLHSALPEDPGGTAAHREAEDGHLTGPLADPEEAEVLPEDPLTLPARYRMIFRGTDANRTVSIVTACRQHIDSGLGNWRSGAKFLASACKENAVSNGY